MTAGEFCEKTLNRKLPDWQKGQINELYILYQKDPEKFNKRCSDVIANRGRGQRTPYLEILLPIIFSEIFKEVAE